MDPRRRHLERAGSWTKRHEVEALVTACNRSRARRPHVTERAFRDFSEVPKRITLEWIAGAKRESTCLNRIEETARFAAENRRANRWRQ